MYGYAIGGIVKEERKKKGVTQKELAEGLCTVQTLSAIEAGKSDTDKLLMDVFLQRLGKSPDKLECVLPAEEYDKIRVRDLTERLIMKDKGEKAGYLLERYRSFFRETDRVQQMYFHRTKAYILLRTGVLREYSGKMEPVPGEHMPVLLEAKEHLAAAIKMTVPQWQEPREKGGLPRRERRRQREAPAGRGRKGRLLSTYELENLLGYGKALYLEGEKERAVSLFWDCLEYMEGHFTDEEERAKLIPKCVWLVSVTDDGPEKGLRILQACEDALLLLRRQAVTYFMPPLLEEVIRRYRQLGARAKEAEWAALYRPLRGRLEACAPELWSNSLFYNVHQMEYHLDFEVVRAERLARQYSQEALAEEIYRSSESLSRVERGKESPNRKKLEGLMQKLGLEKSRYNTYLVADSFEVFERKQEIDRLISRRMLTEAQEKLKQLKAMLDLSIQENARYCRRIELITQFNRGLITGEKAKEEAYALLWQTYRYDAETPYRPPFYEEARLLAHINVFTGRRVRDDFYFGLLEKALGCYQRSRVDKIYRCQSFAILAQNYIFVLQDTTRVKRSAFDEFSKRLGKMIHQTDRYCLICGKGAGIASNLNVLCGLQLGMGEEELGRQYMHQAYLMSRLFLGKRDCDIINEWYKQRYGEEINDLDIQEPYV